MYNRPPPGSVTAADKPDSKASSELMRRLAEMDAASERFDSLLQAIRPEQVTPEVFADVQAEHDTWTDSRLRAGQILRGMDAALTQRAVAMNRSQTRLRVVTFLVGALAGLAGGLWLTRLSGWW